MEDIRKEKIILSNIEKDENGNLLYCASGVDEVLEMLYHAANGKTRDELSRVICENKPVETDNDSTVRSGNLIICNKDKVLKINAEYEKLLKDEYHAKILLCDEKNADEAVREANAFISCCTGGKIKKAVDKKTILTNAVTASNSTYFDAQWEDCFTKAGRQLFYNENGSPEDVDFMNGKADAYYYNEHLHGCMKRYQGGRYEFYAYTKNDKSGEHKGFTIDDLDLLEDMHAAYAGKYLNVHLAMPKFSINSEIDLDVALNDMGLAEMYDKFNANFTKGFISKPYVDKNGAVLPTNIYVDKIKQQCGLKLDEKGTVAWAHTVLNMGAVVLCMQPEIEDIYLCLDKPFFFRIYDRGQQRTLFAGIVNNLQF